MHVLGYDMVMTSGLQGLPSKAMKSSAENEILTITRDPIKIQPLDRPDSFADVM